MLTVTRGKVVTLETTLSQYTPFGDYANADPDSAPTITITDIKGAVKVTAEAMSKTATGQYYYHCQTLAAWRKGVYTVQINATYAPHDDVEVDNQSFMIE